MPWLTLMSSQVIHLVVVVVVVVLLRQLDDAPLLLHVRVAHSCGGSGGRRCHSELADTINVGFVHYLHEGSSSNGGWSFSDLQWCEEKGRLSGRYDRVTVTKRYRAFKAEKPSRRK